jgi:ureidoacrylate peracid hydrolase
MNQETIRLQKVTHSEDKVVIPSEPEPLEIDLQRTAVILVDIQNALVSKGGMIDLIGQHDVFQRQEIIRPIKELTSAARKRGCKIIYTLDQCSSDLHECGNKHSAFWYKSININAYQKHPEWRDKLLIRNTWGAQIVDELKPMDSDIILEASRLSAFCGTNLNMILNGFNIKYLLFGGITTNIAVEAGLRDAFYLDYFPILVPECTANSGPSYMKEATIFNVKYHYGWVASCKNVIDAMKTP